MTRGVIISLLAGLFLFSCTAVSYPKSGKRHVKSPAPLEKGDTVGFAILTSGMSALAPDEDTACISKIFRDWGFNVRYTRHILDSGVPPFGVPDEVRAAELQDLIDSPGIKAVVFYKGGYGAVHSLDHINWRNLRRSPKWIAGYSDVTMIHLAAAKW